MFFFLLSFFQQVQYAPKVELYIDSNVAPIKSNFNSSSASQLRDSSILDGSEVHFKCEIDANPHDEVRIKWFINDTLVIGDYTTEMVIFIPHSSLAWFFFSSHFCVQRLIFRT